ncbi:hypothetical protein [Paenibacillus hexagrammi]|uniref:Uncharacterized protein n=1 Tax=Paenibacillus hexagrammi TaxID=2908839 RepID=A0ABY3SQK9_9BACL|nr:hypothetical protein [Paenibacillus sp. YPD9-1]UJF35685.1 hypothetical protein L0M14_11695 [Paenibacillus sp. YPD9-1]
MNWIKPLLPVRFDTNEIYTIVIFLLMASLLKLIPRRMEPSMFYFLYTFNIYLTVMGDYFLAGNPLNLYDTLDRNSGELFDFILHLFVYPMTMLIVLSIYSNGYPSYFKKWGTAVFIVLSSLFLVGLEWISAEYFDLYTYYNWKFWYSYMVYLITVSLNISVFILLRNYYLEKRTRVG